MKIYFPQNQPLLRQLETQVQTPDNHAVQLDQLDQHRVGNPYARFVKRLTDKRGPWEAVRYLAQRAVAA